MNFPQTPLPQSRPPTAVSNADVVIGMELSDFWGTVNSYIDNGEHGIGINQSDDQAGHQADQHQLPSS